MLLLLLLLPLTILPPCSEIDIVHVYGHQIYAALAFSILNTLDKM